MSIAAIHVTPRTTTQLSLAQPAGIYQNDSQEAQRKHPERKLTTQTLRLIFVAQVQLLRDI
eukprot:COSAG02_NODE_513_length_20826_cov_323.015246_18_plen_61_part_00